MTPGRYSKALPVHQMAYPAAFSFDELRAQRSHAAKLRYCEVHLQKIGSGSARTVFKVDDEKVLKVAKNAKGLAQNQAESDWGLQNYDIAAKVFETDDGGIFVEMELAKRVSKKRFQELSGVSPEFFDRALRMEGRYRDSGRYPGGNSAEQERAALQELWDNNEFFRDLMTLTGDYGMPLPGDFSKLSTWGEVSRNGSPSLVAIDLGMSAEVEGLYRDF